MKDLKHFIDNIVKTLNRQYRFNKKDKPKCHFGNLLKWKVSK